MRTGTLGERATKTVSYFQQYNLPLHVALCGNAIEIFINSIALRRDTATGDAWAGVGGTRASERFGTSDGTDEHQNK